MDDYFDDEFDAPESGSDDSDSSTTETPLAKQIKAELRACLDEVQTEGDFFSSHHAERYVNPGLRVHDLGSIIGLPLTEKDAKAIASVCEQAPFGRKDQTIIDTSVRRTWELDNTKFECQNPRWAAYVDSLMQQATSALGVRVPARALIYKLLLYEEGAFFKAHKDTEKVPGMFGTMVVCLPSHHTGGEVLLSHAGKTTVLDTSINSQFDLAALAWYSDVTHEIKPVTYGYRLVLTYNLVQNNSYQKQMASLLDVSRERLAVCLAKCHNVLLGAESYFVHLLDHKYTEDGLRLDKLKGRDAATGQYLNNVCPPNGFYFLLANMTGTFIEDENGEEYGEEYGESGISLDDVVTPQGHNIACRIAINKKSLLEDEAFSGDCDSEDEPEFTGNEGMPRAARYHRSVAMLVPKSKFVELFVEHSTDMDDLKVAIGYVAEDLQTYPTGQAEKLLATKVSKTVLRNVCNTYSSQARSYNYSYFSPDSSQRKSAQLASLLQSLYTINDNLSRDDTFQVLLQRVSMTEPLSNELIRFLGSRIAIDASQTEASNLPHVWEQWLSGIFSGIGNLRNLKNLRITINSLREEMTEPDSYISFHHWANEKLSRAYSSIQSFTIEDRDAALDLASDQPALFQERILPAIERLGDPGLILNLLTRLWAKPMDADFFSNTCTILLRNRKRLCPCPTSIMPSTYGSMPSTYGIRPQIHRNPHETSVTVMWWPDAEADQFIEVLSTLWLMDRRDLVVAFIKDMDLKLDLDQKGEGFWEACSTHILRFIARFADFLEQRNEQSLADAGKPVIVSALHIHALWIANKRPLRPDSWSRVSTHNSSCCRDCLDLSQFLSNPHMPSASFTMAQKRRSHVEHQLNHNWYTFQTTQLDRQRAQTLVIRKTQNEYTGKLAEWQKRYDRSLSDLKKLHSEFVQKLLGPDLYKQLVLLDLSQSSSSMVAPVSAVPSASSATPAQPLLPSTSAENRGIPAVPPQVAGTKRKIDIIDLTNAN